MARYSRTYRLPSYYAVSSLRSLLVLRNKCERYERNLSWAKNFCSIGTKEHNVIVPRALFPVHKQTSRLLYKMGASAWLRASFGPFCSVFSIRQHNGYNSNNFATRTTTLSRIRSTIPVHYIHIYIYIYTHTYVYTSSQVFQLPDSTLSNPLKF